MDDEVVNSHPCCPSIPPIRFDPPIPDPMAINGH